MSKFMLLLYEKPGEFAKLSPAEIQAVIEKYSAWSAKMGQAGKLVGGEKLMDEGGKHLQLKGSKLSVVDGPYSETKEIIGGYFIVQAKDYADAVESIRDCPHLIYGGRVELRQVDPMQG